MKASHTFLVVEPIVSLTGCVTIQSNSKSDAVPPDATYGEEIPLRVAAKRLLADYILEGQIPPGSGLQASN